MNDDTPNIVQRIRDALAGDEERDWQAWDAELATPNGQAKLVRLAAREAGYTSHSDVCPRCGTQIEQAAWYDESRDGDGHDGWLGQSRCPSCHWAGERYDLPDSPDEAKPAPEPLAEETEDVFAWSPGDGLWARK